MELNNQDYSYKDYLNQLDKSNTNGNHESMYDLIHGANSFNPGMMNSMESFDERIPFNPLEVLDEYEQDYDYMKSTYPLIVRKIQSEVSNQCDILEYSGSCMFDERPDRVHLSAIINTIYNKVQEFDKDNPELQAEELSYNPLTAMSQRRCCGFCSPPPPPMSDFNQYGRPNWLHCLIEVMFLNEMLFRRRRFCCRRRHF